LDAAYWHERLLIGPDAPDWSPLERALVEALLARPGVAIDQFVLMDAMWTKRNLVAPEAAEQVIRECVRRVRRKLRDGGYNPAALVNDPPRAYGLSLDALSLTPVQRPRYIIAC
jgi:DNA-binding winged helix-turn-helix (wHTH) protein